MLRDCTTALSNSIIDYIIQHFNRLQIQRGDSLVSHTGADPGWRGTATQM
ncbi:hypothetical protein K1T71_005458 [Dendrolimus kikuchii]|uniref:Uncharacterized protein n=1 Tax=Dendrolimus kikuchii TaxID=765133 RepID=A0ACC1D453_9NEOP|nr:hypothetical protein K1T71_005458 [Dendrolimus kikuchii]